MDDGIIELDSERGRAFGFTSNLFDGYMWKRDNTIVISFIMSKIPNKGNFTNLMKTIWSKGFKVAVPTPFANMLKILKENNFEKTSEYWSKAEAECEIWIK